GYQDHRSREIAALDMTHCRGFALCDLNELGQVKISPLSLGSGIVSNGSANVFFGQINQEDTLTVTVTAFNCLPVIDTLIITNQDMAFVSSTAFHGNLGELAPGEQDAEALGVEVLMSGSQNPFDLLSLTFNMNGTTDLSDVTALKVYYTGSSSTFGTSNLFGTGAVSAGSITITGAQALTGWVNHFWLAYDIDAAAAIGNMIDAECTGLIISDSSLVTRTPDITAPSGSRLINDGMELTVLTTTQPNTQTVASGDQNVDIICVEVTTTGTPLPLQVNSLTISTSGTTDLNDISSIKVYYTASATFNTNELYGTAAPGSEVVITGIKILNEGINYFWVAYDVASGAGPGNHLDAGCTEVVFAGVTGSQVPSVTHPAGYRQVELNYCIPTYNSGTGAGDYISLVNLNTLYNATGASPSPFYTYYQDVATHLVPGNTYDLIVSPGSYSSGNHIAAWIDFNRNGIFEPAEKLGEANNISPMPATATITFPVPSDATVGIVRLRVREVWYNTGIDPCNNYNYGEAEDYNVHIMPPGCWLGHTNEWNNPANWSDGTVPGPESHVIIPEILMGDHYPAVFTGGNPEIDLLELEPGSNLNIPDGITPDRWGTPTSAWRRGSSWRRRTARTRRSASWIATPTRTPRTRRSCGPICGSWSCCCGSQDGSPRRALDGGSGPSPSPRPSEVAPERRPSGRAQSQPNTGGTARVTPE
ncbi:MAG: BNR-repeat neuraminidase N-terminal domain-containing protein, partial [Candidatus Krumholzibacteriia bacterium]